MVREVVKKRCKCGMLIGGSTEKHAKANIKLHQLSKKHRDIMEAKTNNWEKRIDDLHVEGKLKEVDKD